jgi:HSP20 family protein
MALQRWDPFSELNSLHEQVNSLFNDTFGGMQAFPGATMATDVYSDDKGLTVEAHLPNFKDEEITVQQHNGELEIRAEHKEEQKNEGKRKYLHRESMSSYYRRLTIPKNGDADNISAEFENGVLKVTVPYKELPKAKKIAISAKSKSSKK